MEPWSYNFVMLKELKVLDVRCVDDSSQTRGVTIICGPRTYVSLIFDRSVAHKKTDDLVRLLEKMGLSDVVVEAP
jgi:hypothetical protein